MTSPDLTTANINKLADIFPNVITETVDSEGSPIPAVDFDLLRQELVDHVVEGPQERYRLDWPGKRAAAFAANTPIAKTLRPVREESVDFDTTKNLFIEGDNLEALKLLQESYLGKVKLIYIDPPYNTGNDFIYEDNFSETKAEHLRNSAVIDDEGNRLKTKQNSESNGRFHSDWLSMMYPRLKLARSLLAPDGVIFVSIDDSESANLKTLLDEVFGRQNYVDTIVVEMSTTSGPKTVNAQQGTIVKNAEFVHIYRRSAEFDHIQHTPLRDGIDEFDTHYSVWLNEDGTLGTLGNELIADTQVGADIRRLGLESKTGFSINKINELLTFSAEARGFVASNLERIARLDRAPVSARGHSTRVGRWERFETEHRTYLLTTLKNGTLQALMPLALNYHMSDDYKPRFGRTVIRGDLWKGFYQDMGNVNKEGGMAFSNGKKPLRLIRQLMKWANNTEDGVVLDFFAGSGTTGHAVMQANAEDGGNRRFILVQLDEPPEPQSEVAAVGIGTIAAYTRERLRRSAAQVANEVGQKDSQLDLGFRATKIDSPNTADTLASPQELEQLVLPTVVTSIKPDRTDEDLLFQVLLDWGMELSERISVEEVDARRVLSVSDDALVACFADEISEAVVHEIANRRPLRAVFLDAGFVNDAARINAEQIFREVSPETEIRTI